MELKSIYRGVFYTFYCNISLKQDIKTYFRLENGHYVKYDLINCVLFYDLISSKLNYLFRLDLKLKYQIRSINFKCLMLIFFLKIEKNNYLMGYIKKFK